MVAHLPQIGLTIAAGSLPTFKGDFQGAFVKNFCRCWKILILVHALQELPLYRGSFFVRITNYSE